MINVYGTPRLNEVVQSGKNAILKDANSFITIQNNNPADVIVLGNDTNKRGVARIKDESANTKWEIHSAFHSYCITTYGFVLGASTVAASALLEVVSTSKGFLPPRMTTAQRDAIGSPAEGLIVYNLTTHTLQFYNGSAWGNV